MRLREIYKTVKKYAANAIITWGGVSGRKCNWKKINRIYPYRESCCVMEFNKLMAAKSDRIMLSLICPLHNSQKYLDNLIYQLVSQKTKYIYEAILVDDGSSDDTLAIVKKYADQYPDLLRVIYQKNQGISVARNTGINASKGKYIGFIDHDDIILPEYVEKMLENAVKENADIVKCGFAEIEDGKVVSESSNVDMNVSGFMKEEVLTSSGYIWGAIYKREIFEKIHFPIGYWYEDMIGRSLIKRQSQKYIQIKEKLYYKVLTKENASVKVWSDKNRKCVEQLYLVKEIIEGNKKLGLPEDVYFYRCILKECSKVMVGRIQGLKRAERKCIFLCAREMLISLWNLSYEEKLTDNEKMWNTTILKGKFLVWNMLFDLY